MCLAVPEVAASFSPGDHGSTFGGGPVQCAAALTVLDTIESDGLLENAANVGEAIRAGIDGAPMTKAVRGRGLLIGIELDRPAARQVASVALAAGLLVNDATPSVLRIAPPLVLTEAEGKRGVEILREVLHEIAAS